MLYSDSTGISIAIIVMFLLVIAAGVAAFVYRHKLNEYLRGLNDGGSVSCPSLANWNTIAEYFREKWNTIANYFRENWNTNTFGECNTKTIDKYFREKWNVVAKYFRGHQEDNDDIVITVRERQEEKTTIPVANFRQMMKDGMIPDREEYNKINNLDKRQNITKSKDAAEEARWKAETSQNR